MSNNADSIDSLVADSRLAFLQGRYEESLRLAKQALDIDRKNPDAHQCAGNAYMSREDYESAIKAYKKAVEYDADNGNNSIAAGVIADVWSSAEVRDCANFGAITCSGGSAAGMIALMEGDRNTISNCYNCGALTGSSDTNASAIALSPATKTEVTNCYYLDGTAPERVFTDNVTAKSAERFAAGEVGSLLNGSISDGTQAWYQNIDNNASPDPYPLPDSSRGTIYRLGNTGYFSNSPDFLLGDVNLDGAVNIRDVTAIQRYTAEFQTLNNRQLAAADTDNDGGVTIADATLMQMYFAEFDVAWGS